VAAHHDTGQRPLIAQVDDVLPRHAKSPGGLASTKENLGTHTIKVSSIHQKHNTIPKGAGSIQIVGNMLALAHEGFVYLKPNLLTTKTIRPQPVFRHALVVTDGHGGLGDVEHRVSDAYCHSTTHPCNTDQAQGQGDAHEVQGLLGL